MVDNISSDLKHIVPSGISTGEITTGKASVPPQVQGPVDTLSPAAAQLKEQVNIPKDPSQPVIDTPDHQEILNKTNEVLEEIKKNPYFANSAKMNEFFLLLDEIMPMLAKNRLMEDQSRQKTRDAKYATGLQSAKLRSDIKMNQAAQKMTEGIMSSIQGGLAVVQLASTLNIRERAIDRVQQDNRAAFDAPQTTKAEYDNFTKNYLVEVDIANEQSTFKSTTNINALTGEQQTRLDALMNNPPQEFQNYKGPANDKNFGTLRTTPPTPEYREFAKDFLAKQDAVFTATTDMNNLSPEQQTRLNDLQSNPTPEFKNYTGSPPGTQNYNDIKGNYEKAEKRFQDLVFKKEQLINGEITQLGQALRSVVDAAQAFALSGLQIDSAKMELEQGKKDAMAELQRGFEQGQKEAVEKLSQAIDELLRNFAQISERTIRSSASASPA